MRRASPEQGLSARQRLTLFHGTTLTAEQALNLDADQITFQYLVAKNVSPTNIVAAGLKPYGLKKMGAETASSLRRLGFDALYLVDPVFCMEMNGAYGANSVIEAFLVTPADAVALAGSEAMHILNINLQKLLETCAGAPTEAASVIQQSWDEKSNVSVSATTLLDTGLRATQLKSIGFNVVNIQKLMNPSADEFAKLGFKL
jgi:hypothetical protein